MKICTRISITFGEAIFETTSVGRQGGPESPNLFIDFVMRLFIEKSHNIQEIKFFEHQFRVHCKTLTREERILMCNNDLKYWRSTIIPWSGYTDDLVIYLQSLESLQKATELIDDIFTKFGISINKTKTETMILNVD